MTEGYSPSWEKLNLVPEGEVTLEPEEKGELAAVSCRPPAEWDRNHSFASSWVRSWEVGIYLDRRKSSWDYLRTTLTKMNSVEMTMNIYIRRWYYKKIRSLHILKLKKFLFATWPPLGKFAIPFSLEGIHKREQDWWMLKKAVTGRICNMLIHDSVMSKPPPWQDRSNKTSCC